MASRSSIPAWRIPWTEEPGGLHFVGQGKNAFGRQFSEGFIYVFLFVCFILFFPFLFLSMG